MYAIVEVANKQFRVTKDDLLTVPLLDKEVGEKIELDRVLLYSDGTQVKIGKPILKGARVSGEVVEHGRDKRVLVFKKKRRKGFKVKRGHRQHFTKIRIKSLST